LVQLSNYLGGKRWVGHVACTEQKEYGDLVGKPEGKRELERPRSDQRIMVNWTSKKYNGRDKRWALDDVVMNFHVALNAGNSLTD
jgi:hypothetical protein